jgi:hypothetical protein
MRSNRGVGLLLLSVGAACGGSGSATATDAESNGDGENTTSEGGPSTGGTTPDAQGSAADDGPSFDGRLVDTGDTSTLAVDLGTAGGFVILAMSGISTVPTSAITGDLGVSPAAASYVTGFALVADPTNVFSTSPQVTGKVYASNYAVPTPANLTTAISDMQLAFTNAAGRAPDVTELGAGNIGGVTLGPGVYQWSTGLLIPKDVTLDGNANDVWIFQIAQGLTVSSATNVVLAGGAVAKNVFWEVAGSAVFNTTSHFEGVVLSKTSVALKTGASITGRLLAQTAVSIDSSAVVQPAQ